MGFIGPIPGMYYDHQKKKYFKVQSSGSAPSSAAYSSADVQRRVLLEMKQRVLEDDKGRKKGQIHRPTILKHPIAGSILSREHGTGKKLDIPQIYANGLTYDYFLGGEPYDPLFELQSEKVANDHGDHIRILPDTQTSMEGSPANSLSFNGGKQRLLGTWLSGSSNSGIKIVSTAHEHNFPDIILGPGLTRGNNVDVFSSTSAPESSPFLFAVGTSEGVMTIDPNADASFLGRRFFPNNDARHVFALEFLADQPNVLLSGGRSGILNITDTRVTGYGSQADTIRHPSSVTHIKQLDSHRIIVAGLKSSLCQYDLRFRKAAAHTQSLLGYKEYHNDATIRIGFDVDVETGVVAAAQEHDAVHPPIELFSLHGGNVLRSPGLESLFDKMRPKPSFSIIPRRHSRHIIPCLKFEPPGQDRMRSLLLSALGIWKYSFRNPRDTPMYDGPLRHFADEQSRTDSNYTTSHDSDEEDEEAEHDNPTPPYDYEGLGEDDMMDRSSSDEEDRNPKSPPLLPRGGSLIDSQASSGADNDEEEDADQEVDADAQTRRCVNGEMVPESPEKEPAAKRQRTSSRR